MIVLGIDPGLSGGLAVIEHDGSAPRLLAVIDIPTVGEKAKRRVHVPGVLAFLQKFTIEKAFIERAQARPDDGGSSAFIYGRSVGALEACLGGMQISWKTVETVSWKTTHGLIKQDKKASRMRAIHLFGEQYFPLAKHHNRAEAALIAWHGLRSLQQLILPVVPTRSGSRAD